VRDRARHHRHCSGIPSVSSATSRTDTVALPFCHLTIRTKKPKDSKYPTELRTVGDHLRSRRLDLGLLQVDVAARLNMEVANIRNWEQNKTRPESRFLPAILSFLGHDPFPRPTSLAEALRHARRAAGLSQRELARRAGFDQSSIALWEVDGKLPLPANLLRLRRFFEAVGQVLPDSAEEESYSSERRADAARRAWTTRRRCRKAPH
jgi:transcriptional regulator with XRE-family HTH domain